MALTTRDLLAQLVAFDTTSRESNLPLIDFVADFLSTRSVTTHRVPSPDGTKANLWATIGPDEPGGVVVSGHTDCVPVDGQPWTTDPFVLTEQGDRLLGRGTSDMKSFVAAALAAVDRWQATALSRPVHLAFSHDEETGGEGARLLVAGMAAAGLRPAYCIIGEPTLMQVVPANKGIETFIATVTGTESHSSLAPRAVNAVEYAARFVTALSDLGRRRAAAGPFDDGFDLPHTTIHTGVINGGTALNIVPRLCEVEFEYRYLPTEDAAALRAEVDAIAAAVSAEMPDAAGVGIEITKDSDLPGINTPLDSPAVTATAALTPVSGTGKVAYGTEAGLFAAALGAPAVICGPGAIAVAHKPDEYVEQAQLDMCDGFMTALGESLGA